MGIAGMVGMDVREHQEVVPMIRANESGAEIEGRDLKI